MSNATVSGRIRSRRRTATKTARRRLFVAAGIAAGTLVLGGAVGVRADNPNTIILTTICSNGQTVTVEIDSNGMFPSGVRVVNSTSVFTIHEFVITRLSDGMTFTDKNDSGVANNHDLVSCTRTGNQFQFTWDGFFTPAS